MNSRVWLLWRSLSVFIHLIAVSLFGFALVFQFVYPRGFHWQQNDKQLEIINSTAKPPEYTFGWKFKFLTYWNMNFQFFIFLLHLICDCFRANYLPTKAIESNFVKQLFRTRDTLFHSVQMPIGWFVTAIFWALFSIKKEFVVNPEMDGRNPWWLTHAGHSIVVPILILEGVVTYHKRSKILIELFILLSITGSYLLWIYYLGSFQDIWVYGVLRTASTIHRLLLLSGFAVFLIILYFFGIFFHKLLWPESRIEVWPKQWSADEISKDQLEFEDFRVRQGLIK